MQLKSGLKLVQYNRDDFNSQFKKRLEKFCLHATQSHPKTESTILKNYEPEVDFSIFDLIFNKNRIDAFVTIENGSDEILSGSGYYFFDNLCIGGVRTLSLNSPQDGHKYFHSAYVLPFQLLQAEKNHCRAFILTVNEANQKVFKLMKYYSTRKQSSSNNIHLNLTISFFSSLEFSEKPIRFNKTMQLIAYRKIDQKFSIDEIENKTFKD